MHKTDPDSGDHTSQLVESCGLIGKWINCNDILIPLASSIVGFRRKSGMITQRLGVLSERSVSWADHRLAARCAISHRTYRLERHAGSAEALIGWNNTYTSMALE
jgi:hypothetical protein